MQRPFRAIALTGLIVGAMDITSAIIMAWTRGATTTRLLQFVASGLLGRSAFDGGLATALAGLAIHFAIAFTVVIVFYLTSRGISFLREHPAISGIVYGLLVWLAMNFVVLPLSAAKPRHAFVPDLIQIGIHMFIIGLPTAVLLRRFSGASAR